MLLRNLEASPVTDEMRAREEILEAGKRLKERFFVAANDGNIVVYDNTSAAGKVAARCRVDASVEPSRYFPMVHPVECVNGIYVDVTGTNTSYVIEYRRI